MRLGVGVSLPHLAVAMKGVPAIGTPPLPAADYTVTDAASLQQAMAAAGDGAIIDLVPSLTAYMGVNITVPNKALTLRRQGGMPPLQGVAGVARGCRGCGSMIPLSRITIAAGAADIDLIGLSFRCDVFPQTMLGQTWESHGGLWASGNRAMVYASGATGRHRFYGCEGSWGYGTALDPFDPSRDDYPEYQCGAYATADHDVTGRGDPYQSWWAYSDDVVTGSAAPANTAVPNGRAYNTILAGPEFYRGQPGTAKPPEFYRCHLHDLRQGIVRSHYRGAFVTDQCSFERIYCDGIAGGVGGTGSLDGTVQDRVTRTLFFGGFARSSDSGNPHADPIQNTVAIAGGLALRIKGPLYDRLVHLQPPDSRGGGQFMFAQGYCSYVGPIVRDCFQLSGKSANGVLFNVAEDGLFERNIFLDRPIGGGTASATIRTGDAPGIHKLSDNILDAHFVGQSRGSGNVSTGRYASIAAADLMVAPITATGATLAQHYEGAARKPAYAGKGPKYATLDALLNDPLTTADIELFVAFAAANMAVAGATVTAAGSTLRGPIGDSVAVTVDTGEYRVLDALSKAVLSGWTALPGTATVGNFLELRHTAAATGSTAVNQSLTLTHATQGARSFGFTSVTKSALAFSKVRFASGETTRTATGGITGPDNGKATWVVIFQPDYSARTGNSYFLQSISSTVAPNRSYTTSPGGGRTYVYAADGTNREYDFPAGSFVDGVEYAMLVSIDTSGARNVALFRTDTGAEVNSAAAFGGIASGALLDLTFTGVLGLASAGGATYLDYRLYALAAGVAVDLSTSAARNAAFARLAPDLIGAKGKGLFGKNAEVFMAGDAGQWNHNLGFNHGTSGKFTMQSGAQVDDVGTAYPWPPAAPIIATVSPGPYAVGAAIELTLTEPVYLDDHNLTVASTKAGTWDAQSKAVVAGAGGAQFTFVPTEIGTHTIAVANNGGYSNPAAISVTVI